MILEFLGLFFILSFFTFPIWINGNYKTIFNFKEIQKLKKYNKEYRNEQEKFHKIKNNYKKNHKICNQQQPFFINEKQGIICNFICDGNCYLLNIYENKSNN